MLNPYDRSGKEMNILMFYDSINTQSAPEEAEYELYCVDTKVCNILIFLNC